MTYQRKVILLGDDFRYEYAKWFCPELLIPDFKQHSISIVYDKTLTINTSTDIWTISTPKMVPNVAIYIPKDQSKIDTENTNSNYIIFEYYPFHREDTNQLISSIKQKYLSIPSVALVDSPRRNSSTDLTTDKEDLTYALKQYEKQRIPCFSMTTLANTDYHTAMSIFRRRTTILGLSKVKLMEQLEQVRDNLSYLNIFYELKFLEPLEKEEDFLSNEFMKYLCSYKCICAISPNGGESIWDCYTEQFLRIAFLTNNQKRGIHRISNIYIEVMNNMDNIWNLKKNNENLVLDIKVALELKLRKDRISKRMPKSCSELEYLHIVNETGINASFRKSIEQFFAVDTPNGAFGILSNKVAEKILLLEKILNE